MKKNILKNSTLPKNSQNKAKARYSHANRATILKPIDVNYQEAPNDLRKCEHCEHCKMTRPGNIRPKKFKAPFCMVMERKIDLAYNCSVWNDRTYENTWYFIVYVSEKTEQCYLVIKEERVIIVKSNESPEPWQMSKWITTILELAMIAQGAPDMIVNLNPAAHDSLNLETWLCDRQVQYRKLKNKIEVDENGCIFGAVSASIDILTNKKKHHGGNHR